MIGIPPLPAVPACAAGLTAHVPAPYNAPMPTALDLRCDEGYAHTEARGSMETWSGDGSLYLGSDTELLSSSTVTLKLCVPDAQWLRAEVIAAVSEQRPISRSVDPVAPLLLAVFVAQVVLIALQLRKSKR